MTYVSMSREGSASEGERAINFFLLSFYFSPEDHVVEARTLVAWFFF